MRIACDTLKGSPEQGAHMEKEKQREDEKVGAKEDGGGGEKKRKTGGGVHSLISLTKKVSIRTQRTIFGGIIRNCKSRQKIMDDYV